MDSVNCFNLIKLGQIDSTNKESIRRILDLNLTDKTIIRSDIQTIGYGKEKREWKSPIGNLYASLSLKIDVGFEHYKQYSFITALSIRQALSVLIDKEKILCKWPNDVLVGGKKISGILIESLKDSENNKWIVIGFGINVNNNPNIDGKKTTSLQEVNTTSYDIGEILQNVIYYFKYYESIYKQEKFERIRQIWLKYCYMINENITVNSQNNKYEGKFLGIDDCGRLLIKTDSENMIFESCDVIY